MHKAIEFLVRLAISCWLYRIFQAIWQKLLSRLWMSWEVLDLTGESPHSFVRFFTSSILGKALKVAVKSYFVSKPRWYLTRYNTILFIVVITCRWHSTMCVYNMMNRRYLAEDTAEEQLFPLSIIICLFQIPHIFTFNVCIHLNLHTFYRSWIYII